MSDPRYPVEAHAHRPEPRQHGMDAASAGTGFDAWDADTVAEFRRHYAGHLAREERPFEVFLPAYRLGFDLGRDPAGSRDWAALEPAVRQRWEGERLGTWQEFAEAVRHAWEAGRRAG